MNKEDFIQFCNERLGGDKTDEIRMIMMFGCRSEQNADEIVQFVEENDIDTRHLWENCEERYSAYDDWEKLCNFAMKYFDE